MELTWYGRTCIRLRGKDAVVVNDPYPAIVGPTGRGITGDVVTFSHPDDARWQEDGQAVAGWRHRHPHQPGDRPSCSTGPASTRSTTPSSPASGPTGTPCAARSGVARPRSSTELDGIHTIHLGDIGHELTQEKLGDIGHVDIVCVPIGGALSATTAAALVAQLDPKIVVPMPVCEEEADCEDAMKKFLHEMGAEPTVQQKLSVTASTLPSETTTVLLESRGKA